MTLPRGLARPVVGARAVELRAPRRRPRLRAILSGPEAVRRPMKRALLVLLGLALGVAYYVGFRLLVAAGT